VQQHLRREVEVSLSFVADPSSSFPQLEPRVSRDASVMFMAAAIAFLSMLSSHLFTLPKSCRARPRVLIGRACSPPGNPSLSFILHRAPFFTRSLFFRRSSSAAISSFEQRLSKTTSSSPPPDKYLTLADFFRPRTHLEDRHEDEGEGVMVRPLRLQVSGVLFYLLGVALVLFPKAADS